MSEDLNFVRDCLFLGNGNHKMSHSEGFDGERINFVIKNVTFLIHSRRFQMYFYLFAKIGAILSYDSNWGNL